MGSLTRANLREVFLKRVPPSPVNHQLTDVKLPDGKLMNGVAAPLENSGTTDARDAQPARGGEARGGDKYQRILEAAVEVIAQNGFFNSPVSAIAARAGVADGTVYLYFKSKDHILRAVMDDAFDRFFSTVRSELAEESDPKIQLATIARLHLEMLAAHRNLAILMQTELRQSARFVEEFSRKHMVDYMNTVREVVRRGQEQKVIRADISDRLVAHCLFGALDEAISSWVFTGRHFEPASSAAQVVDLILNGVLRGEDEDHA